MFFFKRVRDTHPCQSSLKAANARFAKNAAVVSQLVIQDDVCAATSHLLQRGRWLARGLHRGGHAFSVKHEMTNGQAEDDGEEQPR